MTNKYLFASIFILLSITGVYYTFDNHKGGVDSSEYQDLAIADNEKFASGSVYLDNVNTLQKDSPVFLKAARQSTPKNRTSLFAPAINAVAIAKFLNGNLPTITPNGNNGVPNLLSQTGAFSNLNTLTPNGGLIPYDMIEPFWSDGATKKRWMIIPNDGTFNTPEEQIQYSQDSAWHFPRGAVLIKHFELAGKRLETRFEVKGNDDVYYYLSYKWNAAQTDATLLIDSVDEDVVVNGISQSWHYPSRNECASCHFPQNGSVLGPKTRNLNKSIVYPSTGISMNQLVNLSELGILNENITNSNVNNYPAVAAKDDLSASVEDRARTYLDVNCASCHNPSVENIAMFDARYSTALENQNIIYGDVIYDEGLNNPKVIIPQDVPNSMAHFRMNSTQTGIEMPPLAKDVADQAGVQLIAEWINSLSPSTTQPPVAAFSASTTYGAAPLSVSFDASASFDADGDVITYSWNFGDGTTAQGITSSHVYNNSGSYIATLSVNDGEFSDQEITTIIVNNANPGSNTIAFSDETSLIAQNNYSGLAMGVIDMNGDGKDDIVQFNSAKNLRIQYQNSPGQTFTTYNHGQVSTKNQWSTAIADFDQNGYNDILSGGAYDNLKIITNNNGNDSYSQAILPSSNIFIQGSNFVDINNDGWADIFACHDDAESRAYQNNQNGTFSFNADLLSTETNPASDNSGNYASMWMDYDNDGDLDLYISKCRGGVTSSSDPRRINMLWQNDGANNFTEVADEANLKISDQTWLTDFGDIDNDGDLDAIVINHGTGPNLMRNNGNGTFTEITAGSGLLPTLSPQDFYGIQGFFRDFNNDGHLDLMVSGDNHYIFYNNGDGTFKNATNPFNSNQIQSFSVGDINHDGFLDIYAGYANGLNSPSSIKDRIWLNEGNSNNYLNVQLEGTQSNINGIGARVEVYGAWGIQIRDVRSGEGYGLVNSFTQHFGIGVNTQIEKVIVRWPSGTVDEILNPSSNQFLKIVEGEELRENIALNKNTLQSSTGFGGVASRAVDGNTDGIYNSESTTHTNTQENSWWRVDLGNTYNLSTIKVFNRTDCCSDRLNEAKVFVGTINSTDPNDYVEIGVLNADGQQDFNSLETTGRYILISHSRNTVLSLAEVEAYGILISTNVTSVEVTPATATLISGTTQLLETTVLPTNANDVAVSWSSSDSAIAAVDANGLVTAVSEGVATITTTANDGGFTDQSLITVERAVVSATGVDLNTAALTLIEGTIVALIATVTPANADDKTVVWTSNNTTIATVDANGFVTAVSVGVATITATTNDGSFTANSIITVEEESAPPSDVTVLTAPNPADFELYVYFDSAEALEITVLNIYDTNTNLVKTFTNPSTLLDSDGNYVLVVSDIPIGTYTVEGVSAVGNYSNEIIIARGNGADVTVLTAPNPADFELYVYFDSALALDITSLNIYDSNNNLVKTFANPSSLLDTDGNYVLVVSDIPEGTYILEGVSTTGNYSNVIIIARAGGSDVTVLTAPNPADYVLYVYFDSAQLLNITALNIYDTNNNLVKTFTNPSALLDVEGNYVLTVSDIPVGTYTLEGISTTGNYSNEIIIARETVSEVIMLVAPNPAIFEIYVYFNSSGPLDISKLNIYDALGRVVKTFNNPLAVLADDGNYVLPIAEIPAGSYIVEGVSASGNYQKTVIIEN